MIFWNWPRPRNNLVISTSGTVQQHLKSALYRAKVTLKQFSILILVYPTIKEQKRFEKMLFNKTAKCDAEIILLERLTIVYKANVDLLFYIVGSSNENELLLST